MPKHDIKIALPILLLITSISFACTAPQYLMGYLERGQNTGTPVIGTIRITATPSQLGTETLLSTQDAAMVYPGPRELPTSALGLSPYPGITQVQPVAPINPQTQAAYPGPAGVAGSATPVLVYSATSPVGANPYPGPDGDATPTPTDVLAGRTAFTPSITPLVYIVQQGDSCASIALAYNITIQSLILLNNLPANCGTLTAGQQLFIPQPTPTITATSTSVMVVTPTPFNSPTPLPTVTSTPSPTVTLPPAPPWVSSNLEATDPDTVELASGSVQLVWFFAFWDGPCQAMAPLVHSLEEQYENRMVFTYLDIDDPGTDTFKSKLGYRNQPHFFLLDANGDVLHQWQGYVSVEEFQRNFEAVLD